MLRIIFVVLCMWALPTYASQNEDSQNTEWVAYNAKKGNEKIQIYFPDKPDMEEYYDFRFWIPAMIVGTEVQKTRYTLNYPLRDIGTKYPKALYPQYFIEEWMSHYWYVDILNSYYDEDGNYVLNAFVDNPDSDRYISDCYTKAHFFVTDHSYYILMTTFEEGSEEHHDRFVDSFSVTD